MLSAAQKFGHIRHRASLVRVLMSVMLILCACNSSALDAPIAIDSRIKTYIYNQTEVFPIVLHYGYSMHLDLRPKEAVRDIIMGDHSMWNIDIKGNRVFIKANEAGMHTNMTVITNLDVYEFDLFSRSIDDGVDLDLAYVVKFFHPPSKEEMEAVLGDGFSTIGHKVVASQPSFTVGELLSSDISYNFKSTGDTEIIPIVIMTDGKLTYMKFSSMKGGLPKIYEILPGRSERLLDMLEYNGYIVLNSSAPQFVLRKNKMTANITKRGS